MNLVTMVAHLPQQPGDSKRQRKLADSMRWLTGVLGQQVSVAGDDVWIADSTPVECGRSRETAKRSDLAGWALAGAKADERVVCWEMLTGTPALSVDPQGHQTLIANKGYNGAAFDADLNQIGIDLLRPTRKDEAPHARERFLKPSRQCVESIFDTFKSQLNREQHGGRTVAGVCARVGQLILALTAVIWHNTTIRAPSYTR